MPQREIEEACEYMKQRFFSFLNTAERKGEFLFSIMSSHYLQMSRYNTLTSFLQILADKIGGRIISGIIDNKHEVRRIEYSGLR